ncbi:MAG TPA: type II secretion system protein [Tepidisphaeraceae bacterium]|nr:type II secretion system protein [Tepidisphaeraceae bacterium]
MPSPISPARPRRAFSFVEVMFAVTILGIGFIMTAAMFPVTVRQTRTSADEGAAGNVARGAMAAVRASATDETMPPTGGQLAVPAQDAPGLPASGVCEADPRYAWVALYSRDDDAPVARVVIVVTRSHNAPAYAPVDGRADPDDPTGAPANLEPRAVRVAVTPGGAAGAPDVVRFLTGGAAYDGAAAAAPGAFLVIAADADDPRANATVLQLGNPAAGAPDAWELAPGADLASAGRSVGRGSVAFLVGRGYAEPARPAAGFAGPAQDVGVFTTFVAVSADP